MINALVKGITLGLLLAISVGPIVFTVIKQSLNNGTKGGLAFIAGISVSDILLVIFANLFTNLFDVLNAHKKNTGGRSQRVFDYRGDLLSLLQKSESKYGRWPVACVPDDRLPQDLYGRIYHECL